MSDIPLLRLDDNMWGFSPELPQSPQEGLLKQIQIVTPFWETPDLSYLLAQAVAQVLANTHTNARSQLEEGFSVSLATTKEPLLGRWRVSLVRNDSWIEQIMDAIPAARRIRNRKVAVINVTKEHDVVSGLINSTKCFLPVTKPLNPLLSQVVKNIPRSFEERIKRAPFEDPWTELATQCLQTVSPRFVSERKVYGAHRFVFRGTDSIALEELPLRAPSVEEKEENRRMVQQYREFIIQEFGPEKLVFVNKAYGFSLDEMIQNGLPLLPDHIFKVNIGMNRIELSDVESMYHKLSGMHEMRDLEKLPLKEARKLLQAVRANSSGLGSTSGSKAVDAFVQQFRDYPTIKQMPVGLFNQLVDLVMFTEEERERAFTGRKIYRYAISGTVTLGDPNVCNPSSDLFDVLQVFPEFEKQEDWRNYCELLSHIIVKKDLYELWHVGLLLPGPKDAQGNSRWFYIESFCDDNAGNVNYQLLPACAGYQWNGKAAPMMKIYRSTSSARNCIDWEESVVADLNPYGSPGTLEPRNASRYERKYFNARTIPVWVGYLLAEKHCKTSAKADEFLKKAIAEYRHCLHQPGNAPIHKRQKSALLHTQFDSQAVREFLLEEARLHKELPEFKTQESLFFVGHSLGAALSQFYTYYYTSRRRRIPLPGQDILCYESRGPGIDNYQDENFMQFGKEHRELFEVLGQKVHIDHDFEYGDFTPQAGESHLGTTGYDPNTDTWLQEVATIFKPLETAEAPGIITFPTHARRTGLANENYDFEKRSISITQLAEFDHAWIMSSEIRDMFGFLLLQSSKITEIARQVFSIITAPLVRLATWIYQFVYPLEGPRDEHGVLFLRYDPPPRL